jgi:hypothetical protein
MATGNLLAGNSTAVVEQESELRIIPDLISTISWGRVISITQTDPAIGDAIDAGYTRLVLERSLDGGVTFQEVTTPADRPVLQKGVLVYQLRDKGGNPGYLYRTRYLSETYKDEDGQALVTDPTDAVYGAGLAIRNLLSVAQLKSRYLFGVNITNDEGEPLSDAVFEFYILAAIETLEHELDVRLLPTRFTNETHDYYRQDHDHHFLFIKANNYPLIDVEAFRVHYPSGQNSIEYPKEWLRLDKESGHIRVIPTSGTLSTLLISQSGTFMPGVVNRFSHFPHLFEIDYLAGFEQVPKNIIDVIGKLASMGPFNIFGDLIAGAGIANLSLSIDGLSQTLGTTSSATNSGYGARLIQYSKEIKAALPMLRRYYKGVRMEIA